MVICSSRRLLDAFLFYFLTKFRSSLTTLSIGDNEHGFSLRWTAAQAGGVIQALISKAVLEVAPSSTSVNYSLFSIVSLLTLKHRTSSSAWFRMSPTTFGRPLTSPTTPSLANWRILADQ